MKKHLVALLLLLVSCAMAHAQDERAPLAKALDYDTNLLLVADLRPDARQVLALSNAASAVGRLVGGYDTEHAAALDAQKDNLAAERKALAEGTELTPEQEAALQDLRDSEADRKQKMYTAVDVEMRRLKRTLAPAQAAIVDWSPPPDVSSAPDDNAALGEMRQLAARLGEAQRFIDRMRYVIPTVYIQTRVARINEFLQTQVKANTRNYADDRQWIMGLLDEARTVTENDWQQQEPLLASRLLQRLGLLDDQAPAAPDGRARYNWWDMYYLLSDLQTPQMLQAISLGVGAQGNDNAGGAGQDNQQ